MSEYVFETTNLTKVYSQKKVVDGVNLKIRKGDIYGFIGKNGAGKTTTIKLAVGLVKPTQGNIRLFDSDNLSEGRKKIGVVIENPAFYPYMSARQNIEVQRIMKGVSDKKITDEILNIIGLANTKNKQVKKFSLGMKQRLGIGLALVGNPEFLILDEPINGLDPMGIREVRDLIVKLNKEAGITVLISSHILGELSKMCNVYGVISEGKLVSQVTIEELEQLTGGYISLKVNNLEKTLEVLNAKFNITNVKINGNNIHIYDEIERCSDLTSALEEENIIVQSISRCEENYEDYFINLMKGEKTND